ncbi:putative ankyrin repeat protein PA3287 [Bacillus rossius redtenbacheri]|uniref:putative ankyrin repeat protein PA3287 n=1 Tax=Bacillus rossius redtenbacheri TaxID=93214 RepID=UPI002FDCB726
MSSRHAICGCLGLILVLVIFACQVDSAIPFQNNSNNITAIKKLVERYNADRSWATLRAGLTPLLAAGSPARRQLLRVPDDEPWPLKKLSFVPGHLELLTLLLDAGLDADLPAGTHGSTALHWAALGGVAEVAELLLARGAAPDRRTSGGVTPLLLAARNGHTALAERLLRGGADATVAAHDGWTALHCAAARGDAGLARALVAAGANPDAQARSRWGSVTPLDVARALGQRQVEDYLRELEQADNP